MFFLFFELKALFFDFFVGDALGGSRGSLGCRSRRGVARTHKVGEGVAVLLAADDVLNHLLWIGHWRGRGMIGAGVWW